MGVTNQFVWVASVSVRRDQLVQNVAAAPVAITERHNSAVGTARSSVASRASCLHDGVSGFVMMVPARKRDARQWVRQWFIPGVYGVGPSLGQLGDARRHSDDMTSYRRSVNNDGRGILAGIVGPRTLHACE